MLQEEKEEKMLTEQQVKVEIPMEDTSKPSAASTYP